MDNLTRLFIFNTTSWSVDNFLKASGYQTLEELKPALIEVLKKHATETSAIKLAKKFEILGITADDIKN